jgi:uncharacterized protein YbbC (DUF1343 family)
LNARNLSGVRFVPIKFKPDASVFKNEDVGGINIIITDRAQFEPFGLELKSPPLYGNFIQQMENGKIS